MKLVITSLCFITMIYSCQKEVSFISSEKFNSLDELFINNRQAQEVFTANTSSQITVKTKKGSIINFPSNAFMTLDNIPVSGSITLEVKEITTAAEMILNNVPTMSDGKPLQSGGEFFIKATKNGEELKLAPGKFVQVNMKTSANIDMTGMQIFNGQVSADTVNWIPNNTPGNAVLDSLTIMTLFADSMNWINVDKFVNEATINYTVDASSRPNLLHTEVYVYYSSRSSVLRFPGTSGNEFISDKMLAGPAKIIGISVNDGHLYYSIVSVNMVAGGSVSLDFQPISEEALKIELSKLN